MEKYYILLQGAGQKNGNVTIDKKFEVSSEETSKYTNDSTKKEYIQNALNFYYPGLTSYNIYSVRVVTEKAPTNPDAFEKFIAGAATGYVAAKSTNKDQKTNEIKNQSSEYSFVSNIQALSEITFSTTDENEITTALDKIYNEIIDYKWKQTGQTEKEKENAIILENNRTLNMCLRNYGKGLRQLKMISNNPENLKFYEKQYSKLKRKRFFNKYGIIVFALIALIIIILILAAMD